MRWFPLGLVVAGLLSSIGGVYVFSSGEFWSRAAQVRYQAQGSHMVLEQTAGALAGGVNGHSSGLHGLAQATRRR